jgi:hypothetical protein
MRSSIALCSLLLLSLVLSAECFSIPMHRAAHRFDKQRPQLLHRNKYMAPNGLAVGSSIPMGGGWLTLGAYYLNVSVGSPPQVLPMLVDTGSSNTVMPATTSCPTCSGPFFNPAQSSTARPIGFPSATCNVCSPPGDFNTTTRCVYGEPFQARVGGFGSTPTCGFGVTYGGGSSEIGGGLFTDDVSFGGLSLQSAPLGLITSTAPNGAFGGLIGFAYEFNACNPTCSAVIPDLLASKYGMSNVFYMCVTNTNGGVIDMFAPNTKRYAAGTMNYTPITLPSWYNINPMDVLVGGVSLGLPPWMYYQTNDVIGSFVDSGTSVILMSPLAFASVQNIFQSKYGSLPGVNNTDGFFAANPGCVSAKQMGTHLSSFPIFSVVLPGANGANSFAINVPPTAYLGFSDGQYCLGLGQAIGVGLILGDAAMLDYYIAFDKQNSRLGFAPLLSGTCQ